MREKVKSTNINRGYWKGLVSMNEPDPELDEEGNPIVVEKPEVSSFKMIKKMMRLKAKQDLVP